MKQALLAAMATAALMTTACQSNYESDRPVIDPEVAEQPAAQAITAERSTKDFATTVNDLRSALEARPVTIFAEVPHSEGARQAGLSLAPSTLFIFGNPQSGAPLMQANPAIGLDLPMKILVLETDNGVQILRQNIPELLDQYGINGEDVNAAAIEQTLDAIVMDAAQ